MWNVASTLSVLTRHRDFRRLFLAELAVFGGDWFVLVPLLVLLNDLTGRGLWGALVLCVGLLATPPYLPPVAHLLHLAPLTAGMWLVVLAFSLAPLIVTQATLVVVARRHAA